MSSSRAKKVALAQDLIENQARIVKSLVKIGDFDHWCIEASELVDLVVDLVRRDEKYLRRDGLSTRDESLHQISNLNSKFVNLVCFSVFELAHKRLSPPSRPNRRVSIDLSISTPVASHNNEHCCEMAPTPVLNRRIFRRHSHCQLATTTTTTSPPSRVRSPQKEEVTAVKRKRRRRKREREKREGEQQGRRPTPSKPTTPPHPLTPERQQDAPTAPRPRRRRLQ